MKTRIALATASLSLITAGSAFAGEAPQVAWPELDAPISTAPIARNITLSPALTAGDGQVQWTALESAPAAAPVRAERRQPAADVSTITSTAQFPWPELERGLNKG